MFVPCMIIAWLALSAPSALATTQTAQTAQTGEVNATFSFSGTYPNYSSEQLTITRAGTVAYSEPVDSKFCDNLCAPAWTTTEKSSVHVVYLEPGGEPNVVLDLYSGGAHCCWIEQVFSFTPGTMTYGEVEYNFADSGERLVDLNHNGLDEFLTADDSFAYEFTDFAGSGLPIEILRFSNGRFVNVTRSHPKLITKDAKRWLRAFKRMGPSYQDSVGVIAAWAADQDELGHRKPVARYLAQQLRAGHLNSALAPTEPGGKTFLIRLRKFLRARGHLR